MDLTGSLVDTHIRIYPNKLLIKFLKTLPSDNDIPTNILKLIGREVKNSSEQKTYSVQLTNKDIENLSKIREIVKSKSAETNAEIHADSSYETTQNHTDDKKITDKIQQNKTCENNDEGKENVTKTVPDETVKNNINKVDSGEKNLGENKIEEQNPERPSKYLTTSDIDWLYNYLHNKRSEGNVPYLHELLEGCNIELPENRVIKRNPVLEARCVKLRAQQEAREYRKMTKTVDNVRLKFPEDSINYQLKQINRQLIAIGQFIISIFAGFLFGFRGVEWMVGNLDFGFRLLLGVMCALVIALAEIYFLAKKLNEELNVPETVQLGGPPKFVDESRFMHHSNKVKEHQD